MTESEQYRAAADRALRALVAVLLAFILAASVVTLAKAYANASDAYGEHICPPPC